MNKIYGTITGGAAGLIIGITGLLLLKVVDGLVNAAYKPLMIISTIILLIIGVIIGYLLLGKKETIKMPTNAVPPEMTKKRIIAVIALGIIAGPAILNGSYLVPPVVEANVS